MRRSSRVSASNLILFAGPGQGQVVSGARQGRWGEMTRPRRDSLCRECDALASHRSSKCLPREIRGREIRRAKRRHESFDIPCAHTAAARNGCTEWHLHSETACPEGGGSNHSPRYSVPQLAHRRISSKKELTRPAATSPRPPPPRPPGLHARPGKAPGRARGTPAASPCPSPPTSRRLGCRPRRSPGPRWDWTRPLPAGRRKRATAS